MSFLLICHQILFLGFRYQLKHVTCQTRKKLIQCLKYLIYFKIYMFGLVIFPGNCASSHVLLKLRINLSIPLIDKHADFLEKRKRQERHTACYLQHHQTKMKNFLLKEGSQWPKRRCTIKLSQWLMQNFCTNKKKLTNLHN